MKHVPNGLVDDLGRLRVAAPTANSERGVPLNKVCEGLV